MMRDCGSVWRSIVLTGFMLSGHAFHADLYLHQYRTCDIVGIIFHLFSIFFFSFRFGFLANFTSTCVSIRPAEGGSW